MELNSLLCITIYSATYQAMIVSLLLLVASYSDTRILYGVYPFRAAEEGRNSGGNTGSIDTHLLLTVVQRILHESEENFNDDYIDRKEE